ncbi:GNAT domain-containing protein [Dichotomocladium elegans]|nr:GNAT domain-containing protein [Dichotomocladium elegans]
MRRNENLVLVGSKVILVPYKKEHVLKYHDWMQSPFLQEMTASEPLTLDEEYAMQRSWHEDEKKCTFIILDASKVMIGDVNIFLNDPDDDPTFGEIEIMIAEADYRRNGCGLEALKIMMGYALTELGIKTFHAKISMANEPSINLFKDKLGFYPVSESQIFREVTLEWSLCTPGPSVTCDDDQEPSYGSMASADQRKKIKSIQDEVLQLWTTTVQKEQWDDFHFSMK